MSDHLTRLLQDQDIVVRLRKSAALWDNGPYVKLSTAREEAREAAAEIERLRADLERIANWLDTSGGKLTSGQVREIAAFARKSCPPE